MQQQLSIDVSEVLMALIKAEQEAEQVMVVVVMAVGLVVKFLMALIKAKTELDDWW